MNEQSNQYTGWKKWTPTNDEWAEFYTSGKVPFEMLENEYLIIYSDDGTPNYYCYEGGELRKFHGKSIQTCRETFFDSEEDTRSGKKKKEKFAKGKNTVILPRNDEQVCAFDLMKDRTKPVKLITGSWGTGKTMILVTAALEALRNGEFEKIIWVRNTVEVKDTPSLGALPGDVLDKAKPFLGPFFDHAGEHSVETMLNKGTLIVEPLQYIRGRNFENTIIICSESENLTKEHIQLIIARAAEGSEVWLDGDLRQRDRTAFDKSRGIETLIERLSGNSLFGYVRLTKSERSATAQLADLLNN